MFCPNLIDNGPVLIMAANNGKFHSFSKADYSSTHTQWDEITFEGALLFLIYLSAHSEMV